MHTGMKKAYGAALVLCAFFPLARFANASTASAGTLLAASKLRSSAGLTTVLAVVPKGTAVTITETKGTWDHVSLASGKTGWISSDLIGTKGAAAKAPAATTQPAIQASAKTGIVESGTVVSKANVRKTASVAAGNVIEVLSPGKSVTVTGEKGSWYSVSYDTGKKGWVSKALVRTMDAAVRAVTPAKALAAAEPATATPAATSASVSAPADDSAFPNSMTEQDVSQYWQEKVNALRAAKGLSQLAVRPELVQTGHVWATYLGIYDVITHGRPDGSTAEQWAKKQGLPFAAQNAPGGWKTNYFTENIAKKLSVKPSEAGVKLALDQVIQMFVDEGPSGLHYRTIYQPDWNSVGVGWYPIDNKNGTYTIVFVMHYASLVPRS